MAVWVTSGQFQSDSPALCEIQTRFIYILEVFCYNETLYLSLKLLSTLVWNWDRGMALLTQGGLSSNHSRSDSAARCPVEASDGF